MEIRHGTLEDIRPRAFVDLAGIELHRAERYRVFVSMTLLDFGFARQHISGEFDPVREALKHQVRKSIRACDYIAMLEGDRLALLFPETPRQGAEVAARRLADLVRQEVSRLAEKPISDIIPVEIASYPDTAGAKTLAGFLKELADKNRN